MAKKAHPHHLEHWVHLCLLAGLLFSGALLIVGLGVTLFSDQPRPLPGEPPPPLHLLIRAALAGNGVALADLGMLVLIATPILRVAVLAVGWGMTGNRRFMAVSLVVLALLAVSFFLGVG